MAAYTTDKIRNVVLVGHSGSGKTTFAETMLYEAKAINRRGTVGDGNTQSDYASLEQQRGHSLFASLLHCSWKDTKINILDTPGLDDFVGEVVTALKVADTAVILLNARSGVEVGTELIWEYVDKFETPSVFVVNQLDHEKADFEMTLEQAKNRFGNRVLPLQFPVNQGPGFNAIVDALRMVMYVFPADGGKPEKKPIPAEHKGRADEMHNALVEAAAENDEALMEKYFENGTLDEEELAKGLSIGLAHHQFFPVFCASGLKDMGSGRIMGFIHDICPSPADRPAADLESGGSKPCDPAARPCVFIFKTVNEPKVGNVSYFKVYSGVLKTGDELTNADNSTVERFSQLFESEGKNRDQVDELRAGDIGCTVKLKGSHTNQTLNPKGSDIKIERIHFPAPRIRMAVVPPSKSEVEKMANALHSIQEEDPTLLVEQSVELKQTIVQGQGEMHLDIIRYKAEQNFGVRIEFAEPRIPYRETITKEANKDYRHKKQSGGAGQFAEVHMRIEPYYDGMPAPHGLNAKNIEVEDLKWGGKFSFCWAIVGGVIDARFINAIKKGIMAKMEEGPLTGSYCRDIRVSIYDGKMHPVDSNDMAFQIAATMAFKEAFPMAAPQVLEPIYDLEVMVDAEYMGNVMGDLQTRRAIVMGMDSEGHYQVIRARVPLKELHKYSSTLRALTQGKAKFNMSFAEYASVPGDIQAKLMADYAKHAVAEEH
ncbi:MAG: elongation factor G [Haliscomenobacteraceae bacterium CHB4]|nr:Elongation factor G [Saprospiraceae bacterium]MCE7925153.1 elongation factor G [Haliscomenobacteraceae bacterium CHB4]